MHLYAPNPAPARPANQVDFWLGICPAVLAANKQAMSDHSCITMCCLSKCISSVQFVHQHMPSSAACRLSGCVRRQHVNLAGLRWLPLLRAQEEAQSDQAGLCHCDIFGQSSPRPRRPLPRPPAAPHPPLPLHPCAAGPAGALAQPRLDVSHSVPLAHGMPFVQSNANLLADGALPSASKLCLIAITRSCCRCFRVCHTQQRSTAGRRAANPAAFSSSACIPAAQPLRC